MTAYYWGGSAGTVITGITPPTYAYNDGIAMPTARLASDGTRPIIVSGVWALEGLPGTNGARRAEVVYGATVVSSAAQAFSSSGGVFRFRIVGTDANSFAVHVDAEATTFITKRSNGAPDVVGIMPGGFTYSEVATAPQTLAATAGIGLVGLTWAAPASNGDSAIASYIVERATDAGFTAGLNVSYPPPGSARSLTQEGLTPGVTYYFRVKAINTVGVSEPSAVASAAVPARGTLDIVQGAAVSVSGGIQVEVRSDGASPAVLTLGYTAFGTGTAFVAIATIPIGTTATDFAASGNPRNIALVADPDGNLYVIGRRGVGLSTVLVKRYARTAPTTWVASGLASQSLTSTGDTLASFAAAYVPGSDGSPVASLLLLTRRGGTVGAGALSYATIDPAAVAASSSTPFIAYGSDPSWLSTPPSSSPANSATVDVAALISGGTRLAIIANGYAVVDVVNGVVTGVSKSSAGTARPASWAQIVGVNASTYAVLLSNSGMLYWAFYGTNGVVLGSGSIADANAQGGAFVRQWGAYLDSLAGVVTVYYVGSEAGARTLKSVDISPTTYVVTPATVLSAALGAASSTNAAIRVPDGSIDERRVIVAADNLLTGAKSTATYSDRSGNVAPNAPALVTLKGYDATQTRVFSWAFSDPNQADSQSAYELVIERVSDSVVIVTSGKVVSAIASRSVAAATLTNGVDCRWRVRAYDELDVVGAWSPYDSFVTSALGTLTITSPVSDNLAGIDTSSYAVTWAYNQADGYTQTQRRVKVVRTSDATTLSDTTMQASTSGTYTVTGLPTDVEVRVEVSIITNAPSTPTVSASRLITSSYGIPMTPQIVVTSGVSYIQVVVTNPLPSGSRPEIVANYVDRRLATGVTFVAIARIAKDGGYEDHAVKSGVQYAYRVRGVTE